MVSRVVVGGDTDHDKGGKVGGDTDLSPFTVVGVPTDHQSHYVSDKAS